MGSSELPTSQPWLRTPCVRSAVLSQEAGCNIYLKLDNLQPSGSFKSRGIGNLMRRTISVHESSAKPIRFYCSSAGNAGLACATAAIAVQRAATIVVPLTTSLAMIDKLKLLGADVVQVGAHWSEADRYLREELLGKEGDEHGVYVPPFDHPDIWEGHGSLIEELEQQMNAAGGYDGVVCSVGGGGLLCGLMGALEQFGRLGPGASRDGRVVRFLAVETEGADALNKSLGKGELVTLPAITSIADSLGAIRVCRKAFEWAQRPEVTSCIFSDAQAAMACVHFADDERILVEPACGVSIAPAYNGTLASCLFPELSKEEFAKLNIVIVVCGGSKISLQILQEYRSSYAANEDVLKNFRRKTTI